MAEYLLNDEEDEKNRKKMTKAQRKSIFVRKNKLKKGDSSSEDINIEVATVVAKAIEEVDELEKERNAEQMKEIETHQLNLLPEVTLFYFFCLVDLLTFFRMTLIYQILTMKGTKIQICAEESERPYSSGG